GAGRLAGRRGHGQRHRVAVGQVGREAERRRAGGDAVGRAVGVGPGAGHLPGVGERTAQLGRGFDIAERDGHADRAAGRNADDVGGRRRRGHQQRRGGDGGAAVVGRDRQEDGIQAAGRGREGKRRIGAGGHRCAVEQRGPAVVDTNRRVLVGDRGGGGDGRAGGGGGRDAQGPRRVDRGPLDGRRRGRGGEPRLGVGHRQRHGVGAGLVGREGEGCVGVAG